MYIDYYDVIFDHLYGFMNNNNDAQEQFVENKQKC